MRIVKSCHIIHGDANVFNNSKTEIIGVTICILNVQYAKKKES